MSLRSRVSRKRSASERASLDITGESHNDENIPASPLPPTKRRDVRASVGFQRQVASSILFDDKAALATLESLLNGADITAKYEAARDALREDWEEYKRLRTTEAEMELQSLRRAVEAERATERGAMDALRRELNQTREALDATKRDLSHLQQNPPPPSDDAVRASSLFQASQEKLSTAESHTKTLEQRLRRAEKDRDALAELLSRRGVPKSAMTSSSDKDAAAVEAFQLFFNRFSGVWVEPSGAVDESDMPLQWTCSLMVNDEEAKFSIEFRPAAREEEEGEVEMVPLENAHLLPEFAHETIVFAESQTPMFLSTLLDGLNDDEDDN